MTKNLIEDTAAFIQEFGLLHDVRIHEFVFDPVIGSISILTPDLSASVREDEASSPRVKSRLTFYGVSEVFLDLEVNDDGVRISKASLMINETKRIELELNEGGGEASWKARRAAISFTFSSLHLETFV